MPARHKRITDPSEHDAVSRWGKRFYQPGPGIRRYWKNRINRRERRAAHGDIRQQHVPERPWARFPI